MTHFRLHSRHLSHSTYLSSILLALVLIDAFIHNVYALGAALFIPKMPSKAQKKKQKRNRDLPPSATGQPGESSSSLGNAATSAETSGGADSTTVNEFVDPVAQLQLVDTMAARMRQKIEEHERALRQILSASADEPRYVLILNGWPGAGKTTLADLLLDTVWTGLPDKDAGRWNLMHHVPDACIASPIRDLGEYASDGEKSIMTTSLSNSPWDQAVFHSLLVEWRKIIGGLFLIINLDCSLETLLQRYPTSSKRLECTAPGKSCKCPGGKRPGLARLEDLWRNSRLLDISAHTGEGIVLGFTFNGNKDLGWLAETVRGGVNALQAHHGGEW